MTQQTVSRPTWGFAHTSAAHEGNQQTGANLRANTSLPTVLCVDDDPAVLRAAQRVLAKRFAVTTALSPVHALAIAQKALEPFAVVVADLQMPGLSGIELLQCVRQLSPQTARILLSGKANLRTAVDAVNTGEIYRFITKPYDPEHLIAMVTEATVHHRALAGAVPRAEHNSEVAGYVTALNRMLEAVRPDAREADARIEQRVREIVECCPVDIAADLCAAAALSQIGAASLPLGAAHQTYGGGFLSAIDVARADGIPIASAEMLADIPVLARAREILYATGLRVPAALRAFAVAETSPAGLLDSVELSGRILAAAVLADQCARQGMVNPAPAFETSTVPVEIRDRIRTILARDDEGPEFGRFR